MWRDMLDTKELAKELGFTPQNITLMVRRKQIAYVKRGRKYYFPRSVIDDIVKASSSFPEGLR